MIEYIHMNVRLIANMLEHLCRHEIRPFWFGHAVGFTQSTKWAFK